MSTLKSVIYEFYRQDEIVAAKQNLVQYIGEVTGKAIGVFGCMKRKTEDNKLKAIVYNQLRYSHVAAVMLHISCVLLNIGLYFIVFFYI